MSILLKLSWGGLIDSETSFARAGAMSALAPAILRKNCYFKYCIKKLL